VVVRDGKLVGYSTDGPGLARAIRADFGAELRDLRVLILGAGGGAGRAIAVQCATEGSRRLVLVNRTFEKAAALAAELKPDFAAPGEPGGMPRLEAIAWSEEAMSGQMAEIDLIINATPLGMHGAAASPIPARLLRPGQMVYDAVYGAGRTALLAAAEEAGARCADGSSMLLHQGALAFEIWFGRPAPLEEMRRALEAASQWKGER